MRALILQYYERVLGSYWFIPSIMAVAASLLAFLLITFDSLVKPDAFGASPFLYATQPDGARAILSAIGGSMIGVAGTVFSVTMAAVVFASGSFGPRLLTNFMNDRGNQVTLGVFVATFVYSMLVLRSVRDGGADSGFGDMFVPNLAIFGAIILAIGSIGVLIYFIHHVPSNIHISNVIAGIGQNLLSRVADEFPQDEPRDAKAEAALKWQVPPCFRGDEAETGTAGATAPFAQIACDRVGYLQIIDRESLIAAAARDAIIVRLTCRPGVFVYPGFKLFDVWPAERADEETGERLRACLAAGNSRSPRQDINFLFDELVEIAGRALSPGVNDPYTAITCMDWLTAAMAAIAGRYSGDPYIVDEDGKLRAIIQAGSFADYLDIAFGHLRQYAAADMIAGEHFINCLGAVLSACRTDDQRSAVHNQAAHFIELAREALSGACLATVEAAAADVRPKGERVQS
ncbi:DUF2254 domain-containing protein [Jiella sp. MQZ9-1]|uniref:DUF2254 domain-containing protein n=1 Tax=Jiella flava TaxID=2816857 RepID=A0A939FYX5_9HYPH|nr:DUF2254 domain-containing protein [Jiella flava]MBO0664047.1 DUF2254 domain-containing protein [Jiella flava]MCD2472619.1 DUF2254 domain-containing protein [Jiella flava]